MKWKLKRRWRKNTRCKIAQNVFILSQQRWYNAARAELGLLKQSDSCCPPTFTAMIKPLGTCLILSTTPYAPRPSSQICSRSSAFTSHFCSRRKNTLQEDHKLFFKVQKYIALLLVASFRKTGNSANGKFFLFDQLKINIFTAWGALKGIPLSLQSEGFKMAVMFTEVSFMANKPFTEPLLFRYYGNVKKRERIGRGRINLEWD